MRDKSKHLIKIIPLSTLVVASVAPETIGVVTVPIVFGMAFNTPGIDGIIDDNPDIGGNIDAADDGTDAAPVTKFDAAPDTPDNIFDGRDVAVSLT